MKKLADTKIDWLFQLKKKILFGIAGLLTLSMLVTMMFIVIILRNGLIENNKSKTQELSNVIKKTFKNLMMMRNPGVIQDTIEGIRNGKDKIENIFILDKAGTVIYSANRENKNLVFNKDADASCVGCHKNIAESPPDHSIETLVNGMKVHRNVNVIYNDPKCYGCHPESERITGKLIIDRSLKDTESLITSIELSIVGSGIGCLLFLVLFLSKMLSKSMDKYINEIVRQNAELSLLYLMIERLSKTIDMEELKHIVIDIFKDTLDADEIDVILPKDSKDFRVTAWSRADNKLTRKKIDETSPIADMVKEWQDGKISGDMMSDNKREIYIPITKNGENLAFIILRKKEAYNPLRLRLIEVMSSHISVAFENARLYYIAITDELTGLYTQRHFRFCIEREFENFKKFGEKITLLVLDLDNFKKINDSYGHVVGDTVLEQVSVCISRSIRDNDLAFRYGGEEFTVILPSTDNDGGQFVAERIRECINSTIFDRGGNNIRMTISIGVSNCPENAGNVRDLIIAGDNALYEAKKTGKDKVIISAAKRQ